MKKPNIKLNKKNKKPELLKWRFFFLWFLTILGIIYFFRVSSISMEGIPREIGYSQFYGMLRDNAITHRISSATMTENIIYGTFSDGTRFRVYVPADDPDLLRLLRENLPRFNVKPPAFLASLFWSILPVALFIGFLWFLFYRGAHGGGRILAFGKSRAKLASEDRPKVTFGDVAGVDEAKEELQEVIEFLKDPKKFQRLGGKIPKGVLLMGPPGCGKTLLARAVSGEAGVPFLSISGSDFVEMFVGVGAARVRDLFDQARKSAKTSGRGCIIFIDELDAVGRQRFAGIGGGHDEREQTLNALLVEMDGFDTQQGIILMAASNRPDVLDPALLRPGRFDRQVVIDRPDILGREAILKIHIKNIKLDKGVDLKSIARQTPGFSGADIANLANEAALLAARHSKEAVGMEEMEAAIERVMAGPERKSRVISNLEKKMVAYHESGHALLALLIPEVDPLHKVSIIPRGIAALGYTMQLPLEDRYITTKRELIGRLTVLLGGRASERIIFGEASTGAHDDLQISTNIARKMVCELGMSENLGHLTFGKRRGQVFLGRDIVEEERNYSEETARLIDKEVRTIIDKCYARAESLLTENKERLEKLAKTLLEKEVLDGEEVKAIVGLEKESNTLKEQGGLEENKK